MTKTSEQIARELHARIQHHIDAATLTEAQAEVVLDEMIKVYVPRDRLFKVFQGANAVFDYLRDGGTAGGAVRKLEKCLLK